MIDLSSIVLTVNTVSADDKFGHSGFILISCLNKKLHIYNLTEFTKVKSLNACSNIYDMYTADPDTDENSNSKFIAVCCQHAGKTSNLKVKRNKGLDFDLQMFAFDSTNKAVTQVVPSTGFDGKILAFNSGCKSIFFYDYRTEVKKPGRFGEVLVGKIENEKGVTVIKEIDPYIWLVHLGEEKTFAVYNLACGRLSKCRVDGIPSDLIMTMRLHPQLYLGKFQFICFKDESGSVQIRPIKIFIDGIGKKVELKPNWYTNRDLLLTCNPYEPNKLDIISTDSREIDGDKLTIVKRD